MTRRDFLPRKKERKRRRIVFLEFRFAHTMDNLQPLLLNDSNGGGDWKAHGVCKSQIYKRNEKTGTGSEELWDYMKGLIRKNIDRGSVKDQ